MGKYLVIFLSFNGEEGWTIIEDGNSAFSKDKLISSLQLLSGYDRRERYPDVKEWYDDFKDCLWEI